MNKFQKIAVQCAKDDIRKGFKLVPFRLSRNFHLSIFKHRRMTVRGALNFKDWNKGLKY